MFKIQVANEQRLIWVDSQDPPSSASPVPGAESCNCEKTSDVLASFSGSVYLLFKGSHTHLGSRPGPNSED